jgi:hypothetical protein
MTKLFVAIFAALGIAACGSAAGTAVGSPLGTNQLKFAVLDTVGAPIYCDPDFYPVARLEGEQTNAIAKYAEIRSDTELYAAIVAHDHLPSGELTDEQKLTLYRAWKLLQALTVTKAGNAYSFSYRVLSKGGAASYLMVSGTVRVDGVVAVSSSTPTGAPPCPICLAASTLISTPDGAVRVTDIKPGMVVWTAAGDGSSVAAPVLEVGSIEAPAGPRMVHVVLADGRELLASPGHPTTDGRALGSLTVGDVLDDSKIALWELVPYAGERTYDLLPAGPTGAYWANGIPLSSTLTKPLPLPPAAGGR